jgi:predicted dehydrogenase
VVQVGTQRRSAEYVKNAAEIVKSGRLGKIPFARAWIAGNRPSIGHKADAPVPAGVDYDLWLGPARQRPFNPNRFHYEWHWNWDYGTGELGNNGIHGLDVIRIVLGLDAPTRITSGGGKYYYDDDRETPDTQIVTYDFPGTCVMWEHRFWAKTGLEGRPYGVVFTGEKGELRIDDRGWQATGAVNESGTRDDFEVPHTRNFLNCLRSGKRPNADIEEGHKSSRLCHLGNVAYRTGHTLRFDAATETIIDDQQANQLLGRTYRKGFEVTAV